MPDTDDRERRDPRRCPEPDGRERVGRETAHTLMLRTTGHCP
jgi:hypothetical protein